LKFNLNLLNLSFLGTELYTTSIYYYPIVIIEFMNGYYTTPELFEKNDALINGNLTKNKSAEISNDILKINDFEIISQDSEDIPAKEKISVRKNSDRNASVFISRSQIKKKMDKKMEDDIDFDKKESGRSSSFTEIKIKEINKSGEKSDKLKKDKMKSEQIYNFIEYFDEYLEKILYFRDDIKKKKLATENNIQLENCENIIEAYKRKERINNIKNQIAFYKNKSEEIKNVKQKLQEIISRKKELLSKLNENINSYKTKCTNLENSNKNLLPSLTQQKMIYNSFLNKKMVEICFFFFNKKIKNLYFIPEFLQINIKNDNESIKKRFEYYNNNKKRISSMMGYITQLMIYMSKCFDIPMTYPFCLNGSKSFIIRGKKDREKDFLPLHCDLKREDRYGNFETGLNYLKNDFNEIINFCTMFPQIISEHEYNKLYKEKENNVFFYFFINFNHCLLEFVKNIQKIFN